MLTRLLRLVPFALVGGMMLASCGGNDQVVRPYAAGFDRTVQALAGPGGARLEPKAIKGTYGANCTLHAGQTWDLNLNDPTDTSLEVVLNEPVASCPLTMNSILVKVAGGAIVEFPLAPPIILGMNYAAAPSVVNQPAPVMLAFYTNAKLDRLAGPTYTNDFVINILWSDQALACQETPPVLWATVPATATGAQVPPPNYTVDSSGMTLYIDFNKVVQDKSSGNVVFKSGSQPGEEWRMYDGSTPCCNSYSFAEIDTIWNMYTPIAREAIPGSGDITLPWTVFDIAGRALPTGRTIIFKHTDGGGVFSYELIQFRFLPPARI